MNLRRRPMKHSDVAQFLDIFSEHPDFILLYSGQRGPLQNTLERLIETEGFLAFVFEEMAGRRIEMLGVGGIAFLSDEFVNHAKKPPYFWVAPTLMHRLLGGDTPILSDTEVCRANTLEGLTVFSWPLGFREQYLLRPDPRAARLQSKGIPGPSNGGGGHACSFAQRRSFADTKWPLR